MKKYLLFAGNHYYPRGGMRDYQGSFDSYIDALGSLLAHDESFDWITFVDYETMEVIQSKDVIELSDMTLENYE